jgi:hypothetical protein
MDSKFFGLAVRPSSPASSSDFPLLFPSLEKVLVSGHLVDHWAHLTVSQTFLLTDLSSQLEALELEKTNQKKKEVEVENRGSRPTTKKDRKEQKKKEEEEGNELLFRFPINDILGSVLSVSLRLDEEVDFRMVSEITPKVNPSLSFIISTSSSPTSSRLSRSCSQRDTFHISFGKHKVMQKIEVVVTYATELPASEASTSCQFSFPSVFHLPGTSWKQYDELVSTTSASSSTSASRTFEIRLGVQMPSPIMAVYSPSHPLHLRCSSPLTSQNPQEVVLSLGPKTKKKRKTSRAKEVEDRNAKPLKPLPL